MRRFAYRLALRLGKPNVDAMLRSMTSIQLQEWVAFAELEPFGEDREDARIASIVRAVVNSNRKKPVTLEACILDGGDAVSSAAPVPPKKKSKEHWKAMKAIAKEMSQGSQDQ
jgi:hypothetical protein